MPLTWMSAAMFQRSASRVPRRAPCCNAQWSNSCTIRPSSCVPVSGATNDGLKKSRTPSVAAVSNASVTTVGAIRRSDAKNGWCPASRSWLACRRRSTAAAVAAGFDVGIVCVMPRP